MKFHTFYTTDLPHFVLEDHQSCCLKIGIEVEYHPYPPDSDPNNVYRAHGDMINQLLVPARDQDVVCVLDIDCLPYDFEELKSAYAWAKSNQSFIGNAQNISHTFRRNRPYAAASMIMIHKKAWLALDRPNMTYDIPKMVVTKLPNVDPLVDTCQYLSIAADEVGFPYRLLLPKGYDDSKSSYQLGPYCSYGRGTTYPGTWHFFRISSFKEGKPKIWKKRVADILSSKPLIPKYPSMSTQFEKIQPVHKRFFKTIKKIIRNRPT